MKPPTAAASATILLALASLFGVGGGVLAAVGMFSPRHHQQRCAIDFPTFNSSSFSSIQNQGFEIQIDSRNRTFIAHKRSSSVCDVKVHFGGLTAKRFLPKALPLIHWDDSDLVNYRFDLFIQNLAYCNALISIVSIKGDHVLAQPPPTTFRISPQGHVRHAIGLVSGISQWTVNVRMIINDERLGFQYLIPNPFEIESLNHPNQEPITLAKYRILAFLSLSLTSIVLFLMNRNADIKTIKSGQLANEAAAATNPESMDSATKLDMKEIVSELLNKCNNSQPQQQRPTMTDATNKTLNTTTTTTKSTNKTKPRPNGTEKPADAPTAKTHKVNARKRKTKNGQLKIAEPKTAETSSVRQKIRSRSVKEEELVEVLKEPCPMEIAEIKMKKPEVVYTKIHDGGHSTLPQPNQEKLPYQPKPIGYGRPVSKKPDKSFKYGPVKTGSTFDFWANLDFSKVDLSRYPSPTVIRSFQPVNIGSAYMSNMERLQELNRKLNRKSPDWSFQ